MGITVSKKGDFLVVTLKIQVILTALALYIEVGIAKVISSYCRQKADSYCQNKNPWYFPLIYIIKGFNRPTLRKTTPRLTRTGQ